MSARTRTDAPIGAREYTEVEEALWQLQEHFAKRASTNTQTVADALNTLHQAWRSAAVAQGREARNG